MQSRSPILRTAAGAVLAAVLALGAVAPACAQLVTRNPRVNDGQLMIDPLLCQSDYEVRKAIAAAGFTNIFLNAPIENHIRARASKGKTVYLIDYNRCLGARIVDIEPLRAAK